ncbi:PrsW family glutamic-type intramembrane protease [Lentibacillus sp. N15]|uniref:PrsW family intramembrane metalloprotease n=1 Tax=Lentibacillus songyuanensis TaxID=3136161 RepID=UPI0031BAE100
MFCQSCGIQVDYESYNFCPGCGVALHETVNTQSGGQWIDRGTAASATAENSGNRITHQVKGTFLNATQKINSMVGEQGTIDLNLRDVFSDVLKKHAKEEGEKLFIAGTKETTPSSWDISTSWPKPWLFSRVFLIFAVTYVLLSVATFSFHNINALPGLIMVGSFAVPFSLLIFFWETNAPQNISIYEVAKMFFIGGASSLVITLFLYSIFPVDDPDFIGAVIIGIVEEIGKFAIVAYFIKQLHTKFILNGLLIGATIGAGFAAFETMGYALTFWDMYNEQVMVSVMFVRAWTSIGTHVVWAAIAGAAFVVVKGDRSVYSEHFFNPKFLKLFAVPVILHAVWDMPLYALQNFYLIYIVLIIVAWIFVFTFINAGLKQIVRLNQGYQEYEEASQG